MVKKIIIVIGSARKKATYNAACRFLENLRESGPVESEIIFLNQYKITPCSGCIACFSKGEKFCPLKDDRDVLLKKIEAADGILLATPNYAFHVSGIMKNFLDRLAFMLHRPRYFGKVYTDIVCQGIFGGHRIVKYLDSMGSRLGFTVVKGSVLTALDPVSLKDKRKNEAALHQQSSLFYKKLYETSPAVPTFAHLLMFRIARTSIKLLPDSNSPDYTYYQEKGWFTSEYYYPVHLNLLKRTTGIFFDSIAKRIVLSK